MKGKKSRAPEQLSPKSQEPAGRAPRRMVRYVTAFLLGGLVAAGLAFLVGAWSPFRGPALPAAPSLHGTGLLPWHGRRSFRPSIGNLSTMSPDYSVNHVPGLYLSSTQGAALGSIVAVPARRDCLTTANGRLSEPPL
jgi:hypothetical protein